MTDTTRRQFFKRAGQAAGATLLTAGLPGSSKNKPKPKPIPKKVAPVRKGLGPQAKAYRKFLHFITKGNYDVVKGHTGVYTKEYPKSQTGKISPITGSSVDRTLTLNQATSKGVYNVPESRNVARDAFLGATQKQVWKGEDVSKTRVRRHSKEGTAKNVKSQQAWPRAQLALQSKQAEKLPGFVDSDTRRSYPKTITPEGWEKEIKVQTKVARTALAKEIKAERSRKKSISKRGIFEKIKSKVKKVTDKVKGRKIYGGGGGKMPSSGMETAKDPTGMSLIRKYTL